MIKIGKMNTLRVAKVITEGIYLDGEEHGDIFVGGRRLAIGDLMEVFLFRDVDGRVAATTERPTVQVDQFAVLKVTGLHPDIGAFLDWGLRKDLLMPMREVDSPVRVGDLVVVYVFVDPETGKIFASSKLSDWVSNPPSTYETGQPVDLVIARETPLGYVALVNDSDLGLLYHSTLHEALEKGQRMQGFVGKLRDDGKLDLTLDSSGSVRVNSLTDQILAALKRNDGKILLDDDSSPEEIRAAFGASKKAYKQALGSLFKQRLIRFLKPGVELVKEPVRLKHR